MHLMAVNRLAQTATEWVWSPADVFGKSMGFGMLLFFFQWKNKTHFHLETRLELLYNYLTFV